jgi:hypothetical protein
MEIKTTTPKRVVLGIAILAIIVGFANLRVISASEDDKPQQVQSLSKYGVTILLASPTDLSGHTAFSILVKSTVGPIFVVQMQLSLSQLPATGLVLNDVKEGGISIFDLGSRQLQKVLPASYVEVVSSLSGLGEIKEPMGNLAIPGPASGVEVDTSTVTAYTTGTMLLVAVTATAPSSATLTVTVTITK